MNGRAVDVGLTGLALGRLALGALAIASPKHAARAFGMHETLGPELEYMTRIFGIRAIALGAGYLTSEGEARRRWQRLGFMCDVSDTITGIGHLRRGDLPDNTAATSTALTGGYAAIGAARVAADAMSTSSTG